jgi:hypothetical protein
MFLDISDALNQGLALVNNFGYGFGAIRHDRLAGIGNKE